jgi:hypothetical protein
MGVDEGRKNNALPEINRLPVNFRLDRPFFSQGNNFALGNRNEAVFYGRGIDRIDPAGFIKRDVCFHLQVKVFYSEIRNPYSLI